MNIDTAHQARLSHRMAETHNPAWSPDGASLLFFETQNGEDWIVTMRADGSASKRLTQGVVPAWSSDGHRIFISRDKNIFSIRPDGTDEELIIADGFRPQPSPNGTRLAFVRGAWPASAIFLVNIDGTGLRQITPLRVPIQTGEP